MSTDCSTAMMWPFELGAKHLLDILDYNFYQVYISVCMYIYYIYIYISIILTIQYKEYCLKKLLEK